MKVIIHAPSPAALVRARANVRDLLTAAVPGTVRVLASHEGVVAVLDQPDLEVDRLTILCSDALLRAGRRAPGGMEITPNATVLITRLQRKGWAYVRA